MEPLTIEYIAGNRQIRKVIRQPKWLQVILLSVLGYEGAGCLAGGSLLIAAPDGHLMDMPVDIMRGAFSDFFIPGLVLFGLGILNALAFVAVWRQNQNGWIFSSIALGGLAIWFWVEIAVLLKLHWLHAMWGFPVIVGGIATIPLLPSRDLLNKGLILCGMLASLLYIVITCIVIAQWPGYSAMSQTESELSAIGAPTRKLWLVLSTPYTLLMFAFAWGVSKSASKNPTLRIAAFFLLLYSAMGFLWPFVPIHPRETLAAKGAAFRDTLHLALDLGSKIMYLIALLFAGVSFGRRFLFYSISTFIILLAFGTFTFLEMPRLSTGQPTPLIGLLERVNTGAFLLWIMVLAIALLKDNAPTRSVARLTNGRVKTVIQK